MNPPVIVHGHSNEHDLTGLPTLPCCGPSRQRAGSCTQSPGPALFLAAVKPTSIYCTLVLRCGKEQGRAAPTCGRSQTNEAVNDALNKQKGREEVEKGEIFVVVAPLTIIYWVTIIYNPNWDIF